MVLWVWINLARLGMFQRHGRCADLLASAAWQSHAVIAIAALPCCNVGVVPLPVFDMSMNVKTFQQSRGPLSLFIVLPSIAVHCLEFAATHTAVVAKQLHHQRNPIRCSSMHTFP